ncbi:MAG: ABC transporter ATP-binding protein [Devosia sp.]
MNTTQKSQPLVVGKNVSRSFEQGGTGVQAVAPASFEIAFGDRVAIAGRSGSGKSTLLHLISGIDIPSAGDLSWPALGMREDLRPGKIAVMFQSPSLVPTLSVLENVALPLALLGVAVDRDGKALEALGLFGLEDLAGKLPEELSGGQAQRVALARAIVGQPDLVIADEPTGQVDRATGTVVMETLIAWAEASGAALLIATHDQAIADRLPHSWQMDHGRLSTARQEMAL